MPDAAPEVVLDGFDNDRVRHNIVNGLKWGPDGWLYGRHGILASSEVGVPGTPREQRTRINCSLFRCHPLTRRFDVVCHGTTNSWGHDWDEHGQLFFINSVIGHLWHALPGARYRRMYGNHFDKFLYELIPQTGDHFHWDQGNEHWADLKKKGMTLPTDATGGGHAHCGMMIYGADNWPEEYRGQVFTLNLHGRRINRDTLSRHGAGYVGRHANDLMRTRDLWFRGIDLGYGPDGGVFVLDWSDIGECHESDGIHRTSGRIFKITHGKPKPLTGDLGKRSSLELAKLQTHPNEWHARMARRVLQERAATGVALGQALGLGQADSVAPRFRGRSGVAAHDLVRNQPGRGGRPRRGCSVARPVSNPQGPTIYSPPSGSRSLARRQVKRGVHAVPYLENTAWARLPPDLM